MKTKSYATSISISGYTFLGPFRSTESLEDRPGVYVICDKRSDDRWHVLDVGESGNVKSRIEGHERSPCWARNRKGTLGFAVYYTPGWSQEQRRRLESTIRQTYRPPCGEL